MKNVVFLALIAVLTLLAGCSITIGGGHGGWDHYPADDRATMAEIDAAADLMMESSRESSLKNIAARPNLSADAQVYLVRRSLDELMMESSRESVIVTLINNPGFVSEAKMAILENMDEFMMESTRREVMDRLNRRGHVPSGKEIEVIIDPQAQNELPFKMNTTVNMTYSTGL